MPLDEKAVAVSPVQEYGRYSQHIAILEDERRVCAYLTAIARAPGGDTVIDVGAGTGVWAIAALKRGYRQAVLIEPSLKMCRYAQHLAAINGVADRIAIIPSTLENVPPGQLPREIDLVVTETLSSLLFGFGCWDSFPELTRRLSPGGRVIPRRGRLVAGLVSYDHATRGPARDGLSLIAKAGIALDLFDCAFRSGGNVYDKKPLLWNLANQRFAPAQIASFDLAAPLPVELDGGVLTAPEPMTAVGVVAYWSVDLTDDASITLSSLDPEVSSWNPHFIRFRLPVRLERGESLPIRLRLIPVHDPYAYAFQLESGGVPVSDILYW